MNKRHVGKQNMTKTKPNPHPWALICGSMSPISAKQRTPGGNGTGSHEPTCMVRGFEALHGSRLISEPTKLTPLSRIKTPNQPSRLHGTPPSHPGTKPRLPWVETCRATSRIFFWDGQLDFQFSTPDFYWL